MLSFNTPAPVGDPIVIVGSGLAGWTLARELRQRNHSLPITMVCADSGDFYSKPMLSNAISLQPHTLIKVPAAQQAQRWGVQLHHNTQLVGIDRQSKTISTQSTESAQLAYSSLVLAMGADPIKLPTPGIENAYSVNNLSDYAALRAALDSLPKARVVIIGGGLIGCEFANDLALGGYQVSVIDPGAWPIANLLAEEQGIALQQALQPLGITFFFSDLAERIEPRDKGYVLYLRSGQHIEVDVMLSAVGLRPRTQLAEQAQLAVNRAIVVDQWGQTSDPAIYALGDCAAYTSAAKPDIANGAPRALPYVMPIMVAAKAIASTIAGQATSIVFPYMPVRVKTPAFPLTITLEKAVDRFVLAGNPHGY